ncbi:MAG: hypothetical protein ACR2IF_01520 [Terriglobales bacterium]
MTRRLIAALILSAVCLPAEAAVVSAFTTSAPVAHACCLRSAHQHRSGATTGFEPVRRTCRCFQTLPRAAAQAAVSCTNIVVPVFSAATASQVVHGAAQNVFPANSSRAPPQST